MKIRPKGNIASIPLYIKILVGMIAGIATGMLFISFGQGEVVQLWIKPWGNIFIRMLQLIAVPLYWFHSSKVLQVLKTYDGFHKSD